MNFSAASFWEGAEYLGELLVIIGCVGEYFAEFREFPRDPSARQHFEKRCLKVLIAGLAIGLIGLFKTTQLSRLEIAELKAQAAKANERASASDLARLQTEKQLAESRLKLAELEAKTRSRRFTAEQRKRLVERFELIPKVDVKITCQVDPRTAQFVTDLVAVFTETHFNVASNAYLGPDPFPSGVRISGSNSVLLGFIKRAFVDAGVDDVIDEGPSGVGEPLRISVGPKEW